MPDTVNAHLAAIADAMDKTTGTGRDCEHATQLARAYITAHPDEFVHFAGASVAECVDAVEAFRADGDDDGAWQVEAWLLVHHPPQHIDGTYRVEMPQPRFGAR